MIQDSEEISQISSWGSALVVLNADFGSESISTEGGQGGKEIVFLSLNSTFIIWTTFV